MSELVSTSPYLRGTRAPRVFVSATRFGARGQLRLKGQTLWVGPLRFTEAEALRDAQRAKEKRLGSRPVV